MFLLVFPFLCSLVVGNKSDAAALQPEREAIAQQEADLPLIVINLDKRPERLHRFVMYATATEFGGFATERICRVAGVDWNDLPEEVPATIATSDMWSQLQASRDESAWEQWPSLNPGSVACLLAHARAWLHVLDTKLPAALIAEDDLAFYIPNFQVELARMTGTAQKDDIDLVQLQSCTNGWVKPGDEGWAKGLRGNVSDNPDQLLEPQEATIEDILGLRISNTTALEPWGTRRWTSSRAGTRESPTCYGLYYITAEGARAALRSTLPVLEYSKQFDAGTLEKLVKGATARPPIAQCDERGNDSSDAQPEALLQHLVQHGAFQHAGALRRQFPRTDFLESDEPVGAGGDADGLVPVVPDCVSNANSGSFKQYIQVLSEFMEKDMHGASST
mmetsp:Transcript_25643/g.65161  ORF Transcript_25643/g.65161 Transcript_25643/m.65161 type:complete len:391 (-) Transcript_25643:223-1395(-)|eukprot:CAMPEP_0115831842 /NCGR_PEP_ID=MMETSP0287-20121206/2347_1 /TAXON_ID=412157 /ORGANISM="Chrysochromulina rotalis, Strain UIO044" /LENGTH=390 /DNA_ID=CAMNT_0003285201 /DNA_START=55 /DNA_END=1227 /DNA_ORIENTATION=-